ncbi:hypothetical protein HH_1735 [Helicobacter hepaticus ATCC 51449]|uniref:Uncharacterized protein n=1 Tax=Helicobacter hepaticus (strain ATCC 51449 / 3B1) TaxID=235279 RepID=Q7VFE2_HELHP|nr:hypothetical protein HH_1735 [Helicobacter hepaticus ATCC 51449]
MLSNPAMSKEFGFWVSWLEICARSDRPTLAAQPAH